MKMIWMKKLKNSRTILKGREKEKLGTVTMQWYGSRIRFDLALLVLQQEEPSFPLVDVPDADVCKVSSLSQGLAS